MIQQVMTTINICLLCNSGIEAVLKLTYNSMTEQRRDWFRKIRNILLFNVFLATDIISIGGVKDLKNFASCRIQIHFIQQSVYV